MLMILSRFLQEFKKYLWILGYFTSFNLTSKIRNYPFNINVSKKKKKNHWPPSKSVQCPLRSSRSPTAQTIWIPDDWSVFSRAGRRPGTVCAGEAGPVGMSWCSLSSAVRWTPGHPILIRFAAAAICPSSMINPGCYLAPTGRAVNTVCVCVCMLVCISHVVPPETFCWDVKLCSK